MINSDLSRQLHSIEALFKRTENACGDDIELRSHWARYLCVVCAGFMENALVGIYSEVCRRTASEQVANFAARALQRISNPKTSRFVEVAGQFRAEWKAELEAFVKSEGRKEAIDSIMANRHLIAHGRPCEITLVRLRDYFLKSVQVLEFIGKQCKLGK
jgi:hypothetical protein